VLAVIEDEQQVPVPKGGRKCASNRLVGTCVNAHSGRHEVRHQGRIGDWRQLDEPDAVGVAFEDSPRHFQRQPRLAATADTRQGQQARADEAPYDLAQLLLSTDEAGDWDRQVMPGRFDCRQNPAWARSCSSRCPQLYLLIG
jgi:hypothetical protein